MLIKFNVIFNNTQTQNLGNSYYFDIALVNYTSNNVIKDPYVHVNSIPVTDSNGKRLRERELNAKFNVTVPFDGKFSMTYEAFDVFTMYRIYPEFDQENACTQFINTTYIYPSLMNSSNFPQQSPSMCPIKPDIYYVYHYILDYSSLPRPPGSPERLLWRFTVYYEDVLELILDFYLRKN